MNNNSLIMEDFLKTAEFNGYSEEVQKLICRFLDNLKAEDIGFVIKIRKGKHKVIAIGYDKKPTSNIATIYIYKNHIKIEGPNGPKWAQPLDNLVEVDGYYYMPLIERYHHLDTPKKQQSIYVYKDVLDKIENIAASEGKAMNEIIESYLIEKTAGLFENRRHKLEFINILKQADLYNNDTVRLDKRTCRLVVFCYIIAAYQTEYERLEGFKFGIELKEGERVIIGPSTLVANADVSCNPGYIFALNILNDESFIPTLEFMDDKLFKLACKALGILKMHATIDIDSPDIIVEAKLELVSIPPGYLGTFD